MSDGKLWGYLQCSTGGSEVFLLNQPHVTIGRASDNTIVLPDTSVSRHQGSLTLLENGDVMYEDHSKLGTELDGVKIKRTVESVKKPCELTFGRGAVGKVTLVYQPVANAVLNTRKKPPVGDAAVNKRPVASLCDVDPLPGKTRKMSLLRKPITASVKETCPASTSSFPATAAATSAAASSGGDGDESDDDQELLAIANPVEDFRTRALRRFAAENGVPLPAAAAAAPVPASAAAAGQQRSSGSLANDQHLQKLLENYSCSICICPLHDPVTSTSCMHSFCGACLSRWVFAEGSTTINRPCPQCRVPMDVVMRNPMIKTTLEDLFNMMPDWRRPAAEVAEFDRENLFQPPAQSFKLSDMRRLARGGGGGGGGRAAGRGTPRGRGRAARAARGGARGRGAAHQQQLLQQQQQQQQQQHQQFLSFGGDAMAGNTGTVGGLLSIFSSLF